MGRIKQGTIYRVSRKPALLLMLIAVLMVALAGCGGDESHPTNLPAANPTPTVPITFTPTVPVTSAPSIPGGPELSEFSPSGGKFTIYLPGKPQPDQSGIIANRDGSVSSQSYTTSYRKDGVLFIISYQDYPEEYVKQNGADKILAAQGIHLSEQKEVTLKSQKDIKLDQAIPGKEYVYGAQGWGLFVQRYYMFGNRLYSLAAVGIYGVTPNYIYGIFDTFKLSN